MENKLEDRIRQFLAVSYGGCSGDGSGFGFGSGDGDGDGFGDGSGDGDGFGDGSGDGDGFGFGSGDGDGDGFGDGSGDGSGFGDGISSFNGQQVWQIDGVATIIDSVNGNFAKGSILNSDFTLTRCYIAKVENHFAHGYTLRGAYRDAKAKALRNMPLQQRIAKFHHEYPDPGVKIPARRLYEWHHTLTGSCEMGRYNFAQNHGISIDTDSFTVREFIGLTIDAYGSNAIRQLAEAYNLNN